MDCPKRSCYTEAAVVIPDDPLVEILSRVHVKSLCRCKCVSKGWRDLIADPLHRKKLPQTLEGFFFVFDSCVDNSDSDGGDPKDIGRSRDGGGSDSDNLHSPMCVRFVDTFGRSQRPVDDCFPFLAGLPWSECIDLFDCCNGLLLFGCNQRPGSYSYIVSNPATGQWVAVPYPVNRDWLFSTTHLVFDPAASSHFYLVEVTVEFMIAVRIYSSNSGVWSRIRIDWGDLHKADGAGRRRVYVNPNGMVYVVLYGGMDRIVVMDVEGNTRKIIPVPVQEGNEVKLHCDYVGQSQGRLHLIYHADRGLDCYGKAYDGIPPPENQSSALLFIWVLEDNTEKWVLKDNVSFLKLFGSISPQTASYFKVVAVHPDHNLVFLLQYYKDELISYNMDSKEVCRLCTLDPGYMPKSVLPYVPYFSESSALENKY